MLVSGLNLSLTRPGGSNLWGRAAYDFNFASAKSLPAWLNFERLSSGTYCDAQGVLKTAAQDVPRFTHDPYTLECLGYLTEHSSTNLLAYSQDLTEAEWTVSSASVTAGIAMAPTDLSDASRLLEDTGTASHHVTQSVSSSATTPFTGSVWLKANGRTWARVQLEFGGQYRRVWVNLSTGELGTEEGTASPVVGARAERWKQHSIDDGWVRVWLTGASSSGSTRGLTIATATADQAATFGGNASLGILIFGAQLENKPWVSSYIATTHSPETRERDYVQGSLASLILDKGTMFVESISLNGYDSNDFQSSPVSVSTTDASYALIISSESVDANKHAAEGSAFINDVPFEVKMDNETMPPFVPTRVAVAAEPGASLTVASNGVVGPSVSLAAGSMALDWLWIGNLPFESYDVPTWNGTIARIGFWRTMLDTLSLSALTAVSVDNSWLLFNGTWRDGGVWNDAATWVD